MEKVMILGASRTPIGSFLGSLAAHTATALGSRAIAGAVRDSGISPEKVDEVFMGCVLSAGTGQGPARQAMMSAGLPASAGATMVNKVCGSGMRSVMMAANAIRSEDSRIAVAGGMESMSRAPYILDKARSGYRLGDGGVADAIIKDGLWNPFSNVHVGIAGELCAEKYGFTRAAQDDFARLSYERARAAQKDGTFAAEITPVDEVTEDEEPGKVVFEKFAKLRPAFKKDGTITAANASKINDGAAALVLASESAARELGAAPKGVLVAAASHSQDPDWFTTAPAAAMEKVLARAGWRKEDVDLFEINEAFSVVALANMRLAGLPLEKVNVSGGAVALGHPIGASGARILVTLLNALRRRNLRRGVASICIGGGEALAVAVESTRN
ncbi:MAG TPA: acetyl-CoA C-acetyltransferase [Elusimicrobia bacterium]|nr:acetyl-CoA C-acetyltransferase [Elusimicrobiota bacterium]